MGVILYRLAIFGWCVILPNKSEGVRLNYEYILLR
jgi:hypothetical protein